MSEKPLENQPNIESKIAAPEGAELLDFLAWKAEKQHEQREKDRNHFSQPADSALAEKVEAKVIPFKKPEATIDAVPEMDDAVERLIQNIQSAPTLTEGVNRLIHQTGTGELSPSDAIEAMGKVQEMEDRKKAA